MKSFVWLGLLLLVGEGFCRSPYFDTDTEEVDSAEHGGSPGRRGTTCPCGWANKGDKRIVGGRETRINEFPFMAALVMRDSRFQFCGGTIITKKHVLTAAHCTAKKIEQNQKISVMVGNHDLDRGDETNATMLYHVQSMVQHRGYNPTTLDNDVSVLFLEREIEFNQFVGPACISPNQLDLDNQYVKAIGWGKEYHDAPRTSPILNKVDLRVVPLELCAQRFGIDTRVRTQVCAHATNKGACNGDSGGPLVWVDPETNRYTVVGVASFVAKCGDSNPSVFADPSAFMPWINNVIRATDAQPMCSKK